MYIREMKESDLVRVKKITSEAYNKPDTKRAIDTFLFHFKTKRIGIDDGRTFWVVELDKRVVGYIGLHQIKKHFALSWFAVGKRFQRRGIGTTLLEFAIDEAKKIGAEVLYVEEGTLSRYKKVHPFYKKFRFKKQPNFRIKDFWSKGDDLVLFVKKL